MARLQDFYKQKVVKQLTDQFGYRSAMQVPRITKITVNMGLGEAVGDKKVIEHAVADLEKITGQKPVVTKARKSVATFKVRETAKDVEFHGVKIPKGSFVQCMVVSANRDEDAFENPDVFDIDRKLKPSFGFGFGPHMCIGQFIAKVEINCSINAILDLFPNIRLDPSKSVPVIEGAQLRGASSLPVIWD